MDSMPVPATSVTVGVDTHLETHVAAVIDQTGGCWAPKDSRPRPAAMSRQQPACGGKCQRNGGWIGRFSAKNSAGFPSSRCHSVPLAATCWTGYTQG